MSKIIIIKKLESGKEVKIRTPPPPKKEQFKAKIKDTAS